MPTEITPEVAQSVSLIIEFGVQLGVIIGLTAVIGKFVPDQLRDKWLPLVALLVGVVTAVVPVILPDSTIIVAVYNGIVWGGSATGLYATAKGRKTPDTAVAVDE